jgi:hypothetical protein
MAKARKASCPAVADMLAALERVDPGFGRQAIRLAVAWPLQGTPTMDRLREYVAASWRALQPDQRPTRSREAASRDAGQEARRVEEEPV